MKKYLLFLAVVMAAFVLAGNASAYTWADVTGTLTESEQSLNISTLPMTYTQTFSNGDQVTAEADVEPWPCTTTTGTFCPASTTTDSTTSSVNCPNGIKKVGYHGTVRYKNHLGYLLWKYRQIVFLYYCPSLYPPLVTSVYKIISEPVYDNYGWTWQGTVSGPTHNPLPDSYVQTYSKGHFEICPFTQWLWCEDRFPWIKLSVNGYGHLYNMRWGIGS